MGPDNASKGIEKIVLYGFGILVWFINAITLSVPGGGFFGDFVGEMDWSGRKLAWIILQVVIQAVYAWWNYAILFTPVAVHMPLAIDESGQQASAIEGSII